MLFIWFMSHIFWEIRQDNKVMYIFSITCNITKQMRIVHGSPEQATSPGNRNRGHAKNNKLKKYIDKLVDMFFSYSPTMPAHQYLSDCPLLLGVTHVTLKPEGSLPYYMLA